MLRPMFARRAPRYLAIVALLLAAQLGACAPGLFAPAPFTLTHEGRDYEVRRHAFLSRGGFVEIAPVDVRPAGRAGFTPADRAAARAVADAYCRWFRFAPGAPDTAYWTTDGRWHFVQGCRRGV